METTANIRFADEFIKDSSIAPTAAIQRSKLAQRTFAEQTIPLYELRVHDALQTVLPTTSATDDLGLYPGTFGTHHPGVKTSDLKTAGATTRYARFLTSLPDDYEAGETVQVEITAGMETTVADTTATVDIECYQLDADGTISADLCATAAQSINSLTAAAKAFSITATTLNPGDQLDVRIAVAVNDAASGTAVIAAIYKVCVLSDRR